MTPRSSHRELEIIKHDLHCNAVRIRGRDIERLIVSAEDALQQGLEVWLSPELWNKSPDTTLAYTVRAAAAAESLHQQYPQRLVLSVGSELILFMQGIIEGRSFMTRLSNALAGKGVAGGMHNKPLNDYLARTNQAVRQVFHGPVTYASLIAEQVDWTRFDFVGVDHYWAEPIKDRYLDMLQPLFDSGKPVVITEFGFATTKAPPIGGAMSLANVDNWSRFLHQLPVVGRFVRPRLSKIEERDEDIQTSRLVDQLNLLDSAGVDGAFVSTFIFPLNPDDEDPQYDLDRESASLVKTYRGGRVASPIPT